jgi:hypothetical protein
MRKILVAALVFLSALASAQTLINPTNQIKWPLTTITGSDSPIQSCAAGNYGQPFQRTDVSPNKYGTCGADGWQYRGTTTGSAVNWSIITANTTATCGQFLRDDATGAITITLPAIATGCSVGIMRGVSAGTLTIAPPGGVSYDGVTTQLPQGETTLVGTDGTGYHSSSPIVAGSGCTITPSLTGNSLTCSGTGGVTQIVAGTGITVSPGGGTGVVTVNGAAFGYPSGTVAPFFGNSLFLVNGYTTVFPTTYSCTSGTCTITANNNYAAGQLIQFQGTGTPSCFNSFLGNVTSATTFQFVISGTSCGTASGSVTAFANEAGSASSCTANLCTITSGNTFTPGQSVTFNSGTSPSCLEGRSFKVLSSGLSSSQFEVDTTNWGNCGSSSGSGMLYWAGATNWPDLACGEQWFSNVTCQNYGLSDANATYKGTLSSLVTNYTAAIHPIMAAIVTAAGSNPVPVYLYTNDSLGIATDEANFLTLAQDLHAEGANVQVSVHTIPPAVFSDPNGISATHQANDWQAESSWMWTQLGSKNALATGKYFDRVIALNGVINPGMSNPDGIHLNNAGTQAAADVDNTEAGLRGAGLKQNSGWLNATANYWTGFQYQVDPLDITKVAMWRWDHNTGEFKLTFGDPLVTSNSTDIIKASTSTLKFEVAPNFDTITGSTQCLHVSSAGLVSGTGADCSGTATNCSSSVSPAVCGSAAAGSILIPTGTTSSTLTVNTSAVTANSQIFFYPDDSLGTRLSVTCNSTLATLAGGSFISARTPGTSFTITFNGTIVANGVCGSYLVVN